MWQEADGLAEFTDQPFNWGIAPKLSFLKKLYGNTSGLKANQIKRLENLYRRRIPPEFLLTYELARDLCRISRELRRQIGILVNRRSKIVFVIVGDSKKIVIPNTAEYHAAPGRLKGLRCIHTHLNHEALTADDLTDLALLRLDLMAVISSNHDGLPQKVHMAHIMPKNSDQKTYQILAAFESRKPRHRLSCADTGP